MEVQKIGEDSTNSANPGAVQAQEMDDLWTERSSQTVGSGIFQSMKAGIFSQMAAGAFRKLKSQSIFLYKEVC